MANLIGPNGQTVNTDDPAQIQEFINRGYGTQESVLAANPGKTIQDVASNWGQSWNAPGGPGNSASTSTVPGPMTPTYPPVYTPAPTVGDISTALNPNFQQLNTGQQGIMSGVQGLATGQDQLQAGQGTILANQGVIQGDVQNVGNKVGGVQSTIGTPSTGQTVLGDLSGLKSGQSGIMGSVAGVTDALGNFRSKFDNYSTQSTNQMDTIQKQGLSQRDAIMRGVQDIQPAINQINQNIPGYNTQTPQQSAGVMTPTAISGITSGLEATANAATVNPNTPVGPQGPMYVDPRNF